MRSDRPMEAIELVENLEQVLSVLRHELGNPVNSLKITLNVLRENYDRFDDEKIRDYLSRGTKLLARQERVIEALKIYSRFNVKKQEEVAFSKLRDQLLNLVSSRVKNGDIGVRHDLGIAPCHVKADCMAMGKVMSDVLENAIDALGGRSRPVIELEALREGDHVVLVVKDNGVGIRKSDMVKIFVPLFTTKPGHMGMGLPIAHKLLSKMEGRIEIKSLYGAGTEARLWLRAVDGP